MKVILDKGAPGQGIGHAQDLPILRDEAALEGPHLMKLAEGLAVGFPSRTFGTAQDKAAADWLGRQLQRAGAKPAGDEGFLQTFSVAINDKPWPGYNVVGMVEGTDPKLKGEYIIVSAHHDSQQVAKQGANDNASGCAVVLALAQIFAKSPQKRSILFVTFDGEEALKDGGKNQPGRRGSKHYAAHPMLPLEKTALMINADMVGQPHLESGPRNEVHQWSSKDDFAKKVLAEAAKKATAKGDVAIDGYPEQHPQAQMFTTDAEPAYKRGVPIVNFLSGRDLDNHLPADDMTRLIPERMAQYARIAYHCAVEAANAPLTLPEMGITPGGMMPTYPLIRFQKSAGMSVIEEEAFRLTDLAARLPELKEASDRLVKDLTSKAITDRAGVDWKQLQGDEPSLVKEPVIARVRELKAGLLAEYHEIKKGDVDARNALAPRLTALSAIEDILHAAIYLAKIEKKSQGDYYLQQIPARLADLMRGAKALGLDAKLEGVVVEKDGLAFSAAVNADRAIQIAKQSLHGLAHAVGQAVFAFVDGQEAAKSERPIEQADLTALRKALVAAGEAFADPGAAQREAMVKSLLQARIVGLKGDTDQKWLQRFSEKNGMVELTELHGKLGLDPKAKAALDAQGAAARAAFGKPGLEAALVTYFGALTALIFGDAGKVTSLEDLRRLSNKKGLDQVFAQLDEARDQSQADKAKANGNAGAVHLGATADLATVALNLARSFDPEHGGLKNEVSLAALREQVEAVRDAAKKLPGGQAVAEELGFWTAWLGEYGPLEARAKEQAKNREAAVAVATPSLPKIWKALTANVDPELGISDKDLLSPKATEKSLYTLLDEAKRQDERNRPAEILLAKLRPYFEAHSALSTLANVPSPGAENTLKSATSKLALALGDGPVAMLLQTVTELERLQALADIQLSKKERGAPLGVLDVMAAQRGKE